MSKLPPEFGGEVSDRVMSVQLGLVGETNAGQNTTEDTSHVEEFPVDEFERTAAVLFVPGAPHRAVEQRYGILAADRETGRFTQDDSLLQDKTQREAFTMLD